MSLINTDNKMHGEREQWKRKMSKIITGNQDFLLLAKDVDYTKLFSDHLSVC
jgi:hypothetical protein